MPPRKTPQKSSPAVVPPKVRRLTVRHLRELHAGVTPCSLTQAHIRVLPVVRARQMLQSMPPLLAEHRDGALEPRGYASTIAALLQVVNAAEQVWCLVHPSEGAPMASPIPLVLEFDHRIDDDTLIDFAQQLIAHWRSLGVEQIPKESIASELSLSATTYCRKVGLPYDVASDLSPAPADYIEGKPTKKLAHDVVSESSPEPEHDVVSEPYPDNEGEPDVDWPTDTLSYEDGFPCDTGTYDMFERH